MSGTVAALNYAYVQFFFKQDDTENLLLYKKNDSQSVFLNHSVTYSLVCSVVISVFFWTSVSVSVCTKWLTNLSLT